MTQVCVSAELSGARTLRSIESVVEFYRCLQIEAALIRQIIAPP